MAVIDYTDVETSLGRTLTEAERGQVTQWIGDAELLVKARLGDLALLDQDALRFVVREAVTTRTRNPEGYQSESIDDYTYRHGSETRRVTILPEWWALLSPTGNRTAFSTRPTFEPEVAVDPWTLL